MRTDNDSWDITESRRGRGRGAGVGDAPAGRAVPRSLCGEVAVSSGDAAALLTDRGREVPEEARAELGERMLMNAVRP